MKWHWSVPVLVSILIVGLFSLNDAFAEDPPPFEIRWGFAVDDGSPVFQICTSGCQSGTSGPGDGQFNQPRGIATNSGNVYVTDLGNDRIQKFDSAGAFQGWLGKCTAVARTRS